MLNRLLDRVWVATVALGSKDAAVAFWRGVAAGTLLAGMIIALR